MKKTMYLYRLMTSVSAIFIFLPFLMSSLFAGTILSSNGMEGFTTEIDEPAFDSGWSETVETPYKPRITTESTQAYSHGNPSNEEQLMLELINASRADPEAAAAYYGIDLNEDLSPGTISNSPKQPLAFNPALISAARNHSQWMLDTETFSHTGQNGSNPGERMEDAGYVFSGSWSCGENIGWSGTTDNLDVEYHARLIIEVLFLSSGHRKNTLSENFEEIGIGGLTGNFEIYNALMVTENFAQSETTPTPMLVGVVYEDYNDNELYDIGEGLQGITIIPVEGAYHAVTSDSGGYAIPIPDDDCGVLQVTASGGFLAQPVTKHINLTGNNVKLDFMISDSEPLKHTVNLSANPEQGGVVSGRGTYDDNSEVTASAVPNPGWIFARWTEDGLIVSSNADYSFTADRDRTLVAHFKKAALPGVLMLLLDDGE
ncbi:MAG: CAP domain-containing protein [Desulfobacterales bacterium]